MIAAGSVVTKNVEPTVSLWVILRAIAAMSVRAVKSSRALQDGYLRFCGETGISASIRLTVIFFCNAEDRSENT